MTTLIAELSCNFLGDMSLARDMIWAAKENGADYVKFQTWSEKRLKAGPWDRDGRREVYRKAELSEEQHRQLVEYCGQVGVRFLTSCFSEDDLTFIRTLTNEVKIPSPECPNRKLVDSACELFDRVFISTGATCRSEYAPYASRENVYLLHCVSIYPCPAWQVNLPKLKALASLTDRFGYSGHYFGIWDAIAAISLGAKVIEKHFTTDRSYEYRDNTYALLPGDLKQIRTYADELDQMVADSGSDYQEAEEVIRTVYSGRWRG